MGSLRTCTKQLDESWVGVRLSHQSKQHGTNRFIKKSFEEPNQVIKFIGTQLFDLKHGIHLIVRIR